MSPLVAMMLLMLTMCGQFGQGYRMKLNKLVVIFRHGFRYPYVLTFKEGDQCAAEYKDDQMGELTTKGKEQMKHLGQVFRSRYNTFLGECGKIQVQYTSANRSKNSAELVAQEICPKYHRRGPAIFQASEKIIGGSATDPTFSYEFGNDVPIRKSYYDLQPTCEKQTHHKCDNYFNVSIFSDQIESEVNDDCSQPDWLTPDIRENLKSFSQDFYASQKCGVKDKYVIKIADGMLGWIGQEFQSRGSRSEAKGFFMSLHDLNIAMVSSRIGIFNGLPIPLGAVLVFELWRLQRGQVVRTFYMNDTAYRNMYQLKIPSCSWDCPINAFVRATKKPYVQCQPAPKARLAKCSPTTVSSH